MKPTRIHSAKRLLIMLPNVTVSTNTAPDRAGHSATCTSPLPHEMGTPSTSTLQVRCWEGGVGAPGTGGWRPGMLPNVLQGTEQPHHKEGLSPHVVCQGWEPCSTRTGHLFNQRTPGILGREHEQTPEHCLDNVATKLCGSAG